MADRAYDGYDPVGSGDRSVNQQAYRMEQGQLWRQYVIAGVANIGILCTGYCMGWTSPVEPKLKDPALFPTQSPLPGRITDDEAAWIGSLVAFGAIFGPFMGGAAASRIGRKWGMISATIPLFIGWVLIAAAVNVPMIYAGRIFWGLTIGMMFTIGPMYCAEIATDDVRGALGSFLQIFVVLGFLVIYSLGPYTSYSIIAYVGVALVALFDVLFFFMPESPMYFITKGERDAAGDALATIRGKSRAGVAQELDKMVAEVEAATAEEAKFSDLWGTRGNIKAMYISCGLLAFQQFSGINVVLFYMGTIFSAAGSSLDPSIATIIIGAVQVGASSITPFVVDRLGRRLLLLVSACGMAVGLGLLGMYFILDSNESPVVASIGFLPVLSLVVYILVYCVGFGPLPWAVMGELMPINIKVVASPIATAFCWILAFLVTRFFSNIASAVGMHFAFWIFGVACVVAFLFTMFLVPETKGKSFQEISDMLNGRKSSTTKSMP